MSAGDGEYEAQLATLVDGALGLLSERPASRRGRAASREPSDSTAIGPFHVAAAVLSSFDRATLRPASLDLPTSTGDDIVDVLSDSMPVSGVGGAAQWKLLADVRRDVLQQLGSRETIQRAIDANPVRPTDQVQSIFEAYVKGTAPPLETQDLEQLAATFEVAQWLDGLPVALGSPLPDVDAIRSHSDYLTFLQPFEDLAGKNFAGREKELTMLRNYVGVLPPGSLLTGVVRAARRVLNLLEKPPLVIHGPGGVGKSALIARFIWEHANIPNSQKFPFVYLDFDRASLRSEEPLTFMIEAVRQLGLQYAEAHPYADRVRAAWQEQLIARYQDPAPAVQANQMTSAPGTTALGASTEIDWHDYVADFGSLLQNVREGKDPCLFVLDTFEEVQYQGEVVVASLCQFLKAFQEAVPRLRIVIAGRVPIDLPDFPVDPKPLGDFDESAANLFLEKRGVVEPKLRRTIIKRIGRSPLSLLLAATAVKRARESGEEENLDLETADGVDLTEAQIQGQLYRRILKHIQDPEVEQIAYPGLALRRVTPDIIRRVLAVPCKVSVPDDATAQDLFDRLAREISLVHFEDGALVHRRDVRRIMLPLLRESQKDAVRDIEEAAIAYYMERDGSVDRAEEIYHRLARHEPFDVVAARWDDDAKPYLYNALDQNELGARERAWLLPRLDRGRKLDAEERAAADLETWEWDTEQRVRELIERNRLPAALEALQVRMERTPSSPLYALEADVLEGMDEWKPALNALEAGIAAATTAGDRGQRLDLMVRAANLDLRLRDDATAAGRLAEAESLLSDRADDAPRALRIGLTRMEVERGARQQGDWIPHDEDDMQRRLAAVSDEQLVANPDLALWVARDLDASHEPLRRVIGLLGLELRPGQSRALARAVALWDDEASHAAGKWKGYLGGGDLPWAETLTQAWTQLLREETSLEVGRRLANLLGDPDAPPGVVGTLAEIVAERAGQVGVFDDVTEPERPARRAPRAAVPTTAATATYTDARVRLTAAQATDLYLALLDAFSSRQALEAMVQARLGRSIDSISFTDNLADTVLSLIRYSDSQGWTASLIAAAIESRPANALLLKVAESLGFAAVVPSFARITAVAREAGTLVDVAAWRSRLGLLETRICRIELHSGESPPSMGTGFLFGPDLLLTTNYMIDGLLAGKVRPTDVRFRFDYKILPDGTTLNPGVEYTLVDADWLVASSPFDAVTSPAEAAGVSDPGSLDYALLRVAGMPGNEPIGGDRAEIGAPQRGWIQAPRRPYDFLPESPLFILHYGEGGPLKATLNRPGVIGLDTTGTRVRYRAATAPGSGGAPCFDAGWELVAMHEAGVDDIGQGIPISLIVRDIERRGKGDSLNVRTV